MCLSSSVCPILLFGAVLLVTDTLFDAHCVVTKDTRPVINYYTAVLLPSFSPVPWPGFFGVALGIMPILTIHLPLETSLSMCETQCSVTMCFFINLC